MSIARTEVINLGKKIFVPTIAAITGFAIGRCTADTCETYEIEEAPEFIEAPKKKKNKKKNKKKTNKKKKNKKGKKIII